MFNFACRCMPHAHQQPIGMRCGSKSCQSVKRETANHRNGTRVPNTPEVRLCGCHRNPASNDSRKVMQNFLVNRTQSVTVLLNFKYCQTDPNGLLQASVNHHWPVISPSSAKQSKFDNNPKTFYSGLWVEVYDFCNLNPQFIVSRS